MTATLTTEAKPARRTCLACGREVDHAATRYFRRGRTGQLEHGVTYTPREHQRLDGKPCAHGRGARA